MKFYISERGGGGLSGEPVIDYLIYTKNKYTKEGYGKRFFMNGKSSEFCWVKNIDLEIPEDIIKDYKYSILHGSCEFSITKANLNKYGLFKCIKDKLTDFKFITRKEVKDYKTINSLDFTDANIIKENKELILHSSISMHNIITMIKTLKQKPYVSKTGEISLEVIYNTLILRKLLEEL